MLTVAALGLALAAQRAHRRQGTRHRHALAALRDDVAMAQRGREEAERTLDVVVHLAHRSQLLVDRQIERLGQLEREAPDRRRLDDLVGLDHLALQARRASEAILAVSGAANPRRCDRSLPLIDVVRSAAAEVEGFRRVHVHAGDDRALLDGAAVADVAHLLAELLDHALTAVAPDGEVLVQQERGRITVIDRTGTGVHAPLSGPAAAIVGALAERHHIGLRVEQGGGSDLVADVVLPPGLVTLPAPVLDVSDAQGAAAPIAAAPLRAVPLDLL